MRQIGEAAIIRVSRLLNEAVSQRSDSRCDSMQTAQMTQTYLCYGIPPRRSFAHASLRSAADWLLPCRWSGTSQLPEPVRRACVRDGLAEAARTAENLADSAGDRNETWRLRVLSIALRLDCGETSRAAGILQNSVLAGIGKAEHPEYVPAGDWLILGACLLAVGDCSSAERFASQAVRRMEKSPYAFCDEVLSDIRADAMAVFGAIRISQGRLAEAADLLESAYEAHELAGDLEQQVTDQLLLAGIPAPFGHHDAVREILSAAEATLRNCSDSTRHLRRQSLLQHLRKLQRETSVHTAVSQKVVSN